MAGGRVRASESTAAAAAAAAGDEDEDDWPREEENKCMRGRWGRCMCLCAWLDAGVVGTETRSLLLRDGGVDGVALPASMDSDHTWGGRMHRLGVRVLFVL